MSLTLVKSAPPLGRISQRGGRYVATAGTSGRVIGIYGDIDQALAAIKATQKRGGRA